MKRLAKIFHLDGLGNGSIVLAFHLMLTAWLDAILALCMTLFHFASALLKTSTRLLLTMVSTTSAYRTMLITTTVAVIAMSAATFTVVVTIITVDVTMIVIVTATAMMTMNHS